METFSFTVTEDAKGLRLDLYLASLEEVAESRTYINTLIKNGYVQINGEPVDKPSSRVDSGQVVTLIVPDPEPISLMPEPIELDIVYEDEYLLVINKQAGLVIHPAASCPNGTLVNALLYHCRNLSGISGELRPGIVHRLDKDTTGLMMAAKENFTHRELSSQLSAKTVKRRYIALVWHHPDRLTGEIDAPIGRDPVHRQKMAVEQSGKRAVTNYAVLQQYRLASEVECRLETGRTHQIRVHMSSEKGCPIIADETYGGMTPKSISSTVRNNKLVEDVLKLAQHQMLHAETLGFIHPKTGEEMEFNAAPPLEYSLVRKRLERDENE